MILIISIIIFASLIIIQILLFHDTTYHSSTGNSYFSTLFDKGRLGEFRIYKHLRHLEKQGARFLFNVYFPKANGETTEIDVLLILSKGFIVFESKNYSGWIFGDEKSKTWTQTLPQGKGRSAHKEKFFNPIMQNNLHIRCLKAIVGENYPIQSIIVFSERCTLKKLYVYSPNVQVVKRNDIEKAVSKAITMMPQIIIPNKQISRLYKQLLPYSQVSEAVKQQHIQNIREKSKKEG